METNRRNHDIVQRAFDKKWAVWSQIDDPDADLDYYRKSGLPIPQRWVCIYVAQNEAEAQKASRRSRI